MNQPHVLDISENELPISNANFDSSILDEDAWEDATDESGAEREMFYLSQWRSSMFDSVD